MFENLCVLVYILTKKYMLYTKNTMYIKKKTTKKSQHGTF